MKLLTDVKRESLSAALKSFTEDSKNANWPVVYFAGHGIELDGSNYLVPVDAKFENDADTSIGFNRADVWNGSANPNIELVWLTGRLMPDFKTSAGIIVCASYR